MDDTPIDGSAVLATERLQAKLKPSGRLRTRPVLHPAMRVFDASFDPGIHV
ncbi:hypothetical protein QO001_001268 [Methylobacterium brachiatum]|jgi:hypothetical protein|uniref:Uncharacterized protein n=1 Tax=Methylobacterium brachiatum TaxID=269660 RepID=A0AAJ1WV72_9HYPH|nr:hypothetical protein [Methylobacterium brachiatum]MCB4802011.1 hypothetical protein [Methylobacterium brachiatum]MDQ0542350.1 hypothetical protein [Methylobacterium brachiatum]